MMYQSKKHPELIASLDFKDEKYKTVMLIYLTGPDKGKSVSITEATFKRWWKKYEGEVDTGVPPMEETSEVETQSVAPAKNSPLDCLNIDYDKVNEPYPEPENQKYIKKPESVVQYEARKKRSYNSDLPEFDAMLEVLMPVVKKVNKGYVKLEDKTTIWRKPTVINIYANEVTWAKLTIAGFKSRPNVAGKNQVLDKDRPYAFDIHNKEDFDEVVSVLVGA